MVRTTHLLNWLSVQSYFAVGATYNEGFQVPRCQVRDHMQNASNIVSHDGLLNVSVLIALRLTTAHLHKSTTSR